MQWARPAGTPDMHAIANVVDGIAFAVCPASWIGADTVELYGEPEHEHRCQDCVSILVARRRRELGIAGESLR